MKRGNRRSEHLLREAELWCATATVRCGAEYPYDALDRIWKTVLLHQFHDILPGSSIAWVHREARETYARVAAELTALIDAAQRRLAGEGGPGVTFNAGPYARAGVPALGAGPAPTGAPTRRGRARQRPAARRRRRARAAHLRPRPGRRPGGARARPGGQPAPAAPRPAEPVGRLGRGRLLPQPGHRPGRRRRGHRRGRRDPGHPAVRRLHRRAGDPPARPHAWTARSRSTGTSGRSSSRSRSRSPCTPTGRRSRPSTGISTGRSTTTPPGTRPGSRCAPTAGSTSESPGTASRSPTTPRTATTSGGEPGGGHRRAAVAAARPAVPRPGDRPGRPHVPLRAGARRRRSTTRSGPATTSTCPRVPSPAATRCDRC